ncbi:MAG: phytanoyl-CoA dioxygenase, partial [Proteobacteria bacterium]|nr:phytanoyl-CoA dioxygenase [Pseudomonadota bacterium]
EIRGDYYLPVPVPRGGALFLHRQTMHASLDNKSQGVRWSFDLRYQPIGQPTGRPWFPDFVARSRSNPATELRDPQVWAQMWHNTRTHLASITEKIKTNRWTGDEPVCAA